MIRPPLLIDEINMNRIKGSFSAELAIIFPLCFLSIGMILSMGLFWISGVEGSVRAGEAILVAEETLRQGRGDGEEQAGGETFLREAFGSSGTEVMAVITVKKSFLTEVIAVELQGRMPILSNLSWDVSLQKNILDPVTFRNRVDLIYEVLNHEEE